MVLLKRQVTEWLGADFSFWSFVRRAFQPQLHCAHDVKMFPSDNWQQCQIHLWNEIFCTWNSTEVDQSKSGLRSYVCLTALDESPKTNDVVSSFVSLCNRTRYQCDNLIQPYKASMLRLCSHCPRTASQEPALIDWQSQRKRLIQIKFVPRGYPLLV